MTPQEELTEAKLDATMGCFAFALLIGIVSIIGLAITLMYYFREFMEIVRFAFEYSQNHIWVGEALVFFSFVGIVVLVVRHVKLMDGMYE